MRMFQLCVCGEPLQLTEQATPKPVGSEVLLKVLAAGVCHSDLHLADGWFDLGGGKRLSLAERGMKLPEMLADLPRQCDLGGKKDSHGNTQYWRGYKLHLDVADGQIPISAVLAERGRRALRVHLGKDVDAGLATLSSAVQQALG